MEPAHVAAALALMGGYYRKANNTPNASAAAQAFEHDVGRPSSVTDKVKALEELEAALQREEAGRAEMAARAAGDVVDDEHTVQWRERVLATMIAADIWKPCCKELSADETYEALCSKIGFYDGMGGFDRSKVEAALEAAREAYAQIIQSCRLQMIDVMHEHLRRRRPTLHKKSFSDEQIVNELSVTDLRTALETRGYSFPFVMVRGEMKAAREECLRAPTIDEMKRAYFAGPPPDVDMYAASEPVDAAITDALSGRMAKATLDEKTRAQRKAQRTLNLLLGLLGLLELTPLDKLDERDSTTIDQSHQWLAAHPDELAAVEGTPPLRPGGPVRVEGLRSRSDLNGATGELVQWFDDVGRWRVSMDTNGENVRAQPQNLVALPDSEPWVADDDPDGEWGTDLCRVDWARRHPLQARALGTRFDDAGRPIWFAPPPAQVLATLTPSHAARIFSGSITERVAEYRRRAGS